MLSRAFIETADFRALVETHDFNYVVGRRGAGKSALFARVKEHLERQPQFLTLAAKPSEYEDFEYPGRY
jgi:ABC-type ATPase involved in cell division